MVMVILLAPCAAFAIPFSSDLFITASVELDSASLEPFGGTQTGSLSMTSGGVSTISTIDGITVTGSNPHGGALTDIGDSVGIGFHVSGTGIDTELYGNYNFSFTNNSASDPYLVTLGFDSWNLIEYFGYDLYAESKISLSSATEELFYTYRYVDLGFGEDYDDTCNGCLFTYDLLLGAGDSIDLFGYQDISGGAFDSGYDITLDANVSILNVANLNAQQVPEPPAFLLLATGVALLLASRKRIAASEKFAG
jgi:hypothetical protein